MKKFINVLGSLLISTSTFSVIACSNNNQPSGVLTQDDYSKMFSNYFDNWQNRSNNPYYSFLNNSNNELKNAASADSITAFNSLYDNDNKTNTWNTFDELNTALTSTKLSDNVTTNVNWDSLYQSAGLNLVDRQNAENQQLKFFDILANLYGANTVLKLVQTAYFADPDQGNVVAYALFFPGVGSQILVFGPDFVNQALISGQYQQGFWSSGSIIAVSGHEYGHAFSNYLSSSIMIRDNFNQVPIKAALIQKNNLESNSVYSDRTQVLMNFLDQDAIKKGLLSANANDTQKFLFDLLISQSRYSRISFINNEVNQRDEYFAESFNYWILTPQNKRDVSWQLLNDFFMNYVPSYYNV